MELAKSLWHETLRGTNLEKNFIVIYASVSDLWKSKLDSSLVKDIKKYGKSLGYKVEVKFERFNWLVIRKQGE